MDTGKWHLMIKHAARIAALSGLFTVLGLLGIGGMTHAAQAPQHRPVIQHTFGLQYASAPANLEHVCDYGWIDVTTYPE